MITYIDYPLQENVILILSYFLLFFVTDINFKDDQTQPTFEMTPGFKPFTLILRLTFISQIYIYIEYFIDSARVRYLRKYVTGNPTLSLRSLVTFLINEF